ncbi:MAG: tetratricopeptide repeat protein [Spirochaetia bacterium]|nr:tetratricopeptide repeat protein [Spirochaetia bacterium]
MRYKFALIIFLLTAEKAFSVTYPVHAYKNYTTPIMQEMEVIGQVTYRSHRMAESRKKILDYDTREMAITARLYESEGLRLGDVVYIIKKDPDHKHYKSGYIVGEAVVYSIFETEFQGWMLKASGNLSMVKKGYFIARPSLGDTRTEAWVLYKEGDKYDALGDYANAFVKYRESLNKDPQKPETYLRLALLSEKQNRIPQSREYMRKAWEFLSKFEDPNDVLILPGLYLKWNINSDNAKTRADALRHKLYLLNEIRNFNGKLNWFQDSFSLEVLRMLEKKGLPDRLYQFQMGRLYEDIYEILNKSNIDKVLLWLTKEEREILFQPLYMPYREEKYAKPRHAWEDAFFNAALYHYELAHELDILESDSAYQIVQLCYEKIKREPPRVKKEMYTSILKHYAYEFLRTPSAASKMSRVRELLNTASHF